MVNSPNLQRQLTSPISLYYFMKIKLPFDPTGNPKFRSDLSRSQVLVQDRKVTFIIKATGMFFGNLNLPEYRHIGHSPFLVLQFTLLGTLLKILLEYNLAGIIICGSYKHERKQHNNRNPDSYRFVRSL